MDAPLWEEFVRLVYAAVATGAFLMLARSWGRFVCQPRPLMKYLTVVVGLNALWRWYIAWLGLQRDVDGEWSRLSEPLVRTLGSALSVLLYVAILLVAYFHYTRRTTR